jgi:tRNA/rRNA methyltransferase
MGVGLSLSPSINQGGLSVVLVEPEQAANIGFVARTLACYEVSDFRIVGSRGLSKAPEAIKTAKGAPQLLSTIRYFPSLPEAVDDCHYSFGFTRRTREPAQSIMDLDASVAMWKKDRSQSAKLSQSQKSALVFGRESQGLSREETLVLSHLVRIPMPSELLSLNISHAVAIGLYAFMGSQFMPSAMPERQNEDQIEGQGLRPTQSENATVLAKLMASLDAKGFFKSGKEIAQRESTRLLWQRLQPTQQELDFLSGMLKRLSANS